MPPNKLRVSITLVRHDSPETCFVNVGGEGVGCSMTIKRGDNRGLTVDKARNHREGLVKPPAAHFTSQNDKLCILIPPNELRGSCLLVRHDSPETCVINVGSVGVGVGCSITILRVVFSLHLPLASRPAWRHVELGETHESLAAFLLG